MIAALDECKPEAAIVSTSPASHADIIQICLKSKCHVFTELNLIDDGYCENISLAEKIISCCFFHLLFI